MPRPAVATVALLAVVAVAGCGGAKPYSPTATRSCLRQAKGVKLQPVPRSDFIARTALGGSLSARTKNNELVITFGADEKAAEGIANAYRRVHGQNIGIEDVLRPKRNAVLLWVAHPSDRDVSLIDSCLK